MTSYIATNHNVKWQPYSHVSGEAYWDNVTQARSSFILVTSLRYQTASKSVDSSCLKCLWCCSKTIYLSVHIYIYIYTHTKTHIYTYIYPHTLANIYMYIHIYIHTYMYIYIYTYTHIHIHTDMWVDIKFYERPFTHCGLVMPFIGIDPCQTLAQEVACCLMVPSHGLDQCCHVINNDVYFTKWQQHCKCTRMWSLRNIQIAFEIPRRQWVNRLDCVFSSSKYKQNSMIIGWTVSFDQASINKRAWQNSNRPWSNNKCTTHIYRFKLNCISP